MEKNLHSLDLVRLVEATDEKNFMIEGITYHRKTRLYRLATREGGYFAVTADKVEKIGEISPPVAYGGKFRIRETSELFTDTGDTVFVVTGIGYDYRSDIWSFGFTYKGLTYCVEWDEIEIVL